MPTTAPKCVRWDDIHNGPVECFIQHADDSFSDVSTSPLPSPQAGSVPYLEAMEAAYRTCETKLPVATIDMPFANTTALRALATSRHQRLTEHHASLMQRHRESVDLRMEISHVDTAVKIAKQDDRVRKLWETALDKVAVNPSIVDMEYSPGITYAEHIQYTLQDVYERCEPILLKQIQVMDEAIERRYQRYQDTSETGRKPLAAEDDYFGPAAIRMRSIFDS